MELRHLRYFVTVAEELNFSRAAERLHMAQPPLSVQIRALEDELRAKLFERDKRHVSLTQAGRLFLDQARSILAQAEAAKTEARSAASGVLGKLSLGYTASSMFNAVLPRAIRSFQQAYPQVALSYAEMSSLDQLDALRGRALDVAIVRRVDTPIDVKGSADLAIEAWYQTPLVLAMAADHPLAQLPTVRLDQLREMPFIVYPRDDGIGLYWRVMDLCRRAGFRPNIVRQVREASSIIGLVAAGAGVSVVPADTRCIQLDGVVYKTLGDADATTTLYLAHAKNNRDELVARLMQVLRRAIQ